MAMRNKRPLHRFTVSTVATVTIAGATTELPNVPIRGMIRALRIYDVSGTGSPGNQVRATIFEENPGVTARVTIPWTLSPIDVDLEHYYQCARNVAASPNGSLWIFAAVNQAAGDHTVRIELDIEALAFA